MKRAIIIFASVLAALGSRAHAEESPAKEAYKDFKIVADRNIFNSERSGDRRESPRQQRTVRAAPDEFRLVGVMLNGEDATAFFEGSRSDYGGQWKKGDLIAGFKIIDVRTDGVTLEKDAKHTQLPMASAMKSSEEGVWNLTKSTGEFARPSSESSSAAQGSSDSDGDSGEVLKRLMERRRREVER